MPLTLHTIYILSVKYYIDLAIGSIIGLMVMVPNRLQAIIQTVNETIL